MRSERAGTWVVVLLMLIAGIGVACGGGCAGWEIGGLPSVEVLEEKRDQADRLLARVREEVRVKEEIVGGAGGELAPVEHARVMGELTQARATERTLAAGVAQLEAVIAEARTPSDAISQGIGALSVLLPAGAGGPIALGGALLVTVMRLVQMRRALESVAKSIDVAAREDVDLRDSLKANAGTLRSIQTPTAKRVIDGAQGKVFALPV